MAKRKASRAKKYTWEAGNIEITSTSSATEEAPKEEAPKEEARENLDVQGFWGADEDDDEWFERASKLLNSKITKKEVSKKGGPGSGGFGHAGRPGKRGGSSPGTAGGGVRWMNSDYPKLDVPARFEAWSNMPIAERDELANASHSIVSRQKKILAHVGKQPEYSGDVSSAINQRISQIGDIITSDASSHIAKNVKVMAKHFQDAGAPADVVHKLAMEAVDSLAAQENESLRRQLGDHGVRHVLADMDQALDILDKHPGVDSPAKKAALSAAAIFHDTGYLTEPARNFLDGDHPRWSKQHYDQNVHGLIEKAIGKGLADKTGRMIETHAQAKVDWNDPESTALRIADNMALFRKEKLPGVFHHVPANVQVLKDLGEKKISVEDARSQIRKNVTNSNLSASVKESLNAAADEIGALTPKFTLGMLAGEVTGYDWDMQANALNVSMRTTPEAQWLHDQLDLGQKNFAKVAKAYGIDPDEFNTTGKFEIVEGGKLAMTATILGEKLKEIMMRLFDQTRIPWGL